MNITLKYTIFLFLNFLFFLNTTIAQVKDIGTPFIRNFERSDYKGGLQTWMIENSDNGKMYFANNNGLIEYDGHNWEIYPISNSSVLHCFLLSENGKIYVGGFNEFGYFETNALGKYQYHSMTSILPETKRDFGEIWRIHSTPDGLIFQSFSKLIIINDDEVKVIDAPGSFHFSFYIKGQLLICDLEAGLLRYAMGKLFKLNGTEQLKGKEIWSILPLEENLLIATSESGLFLYDGNTIVEWKNPASAYLKKNQLYCAKRIDNEYIAFGTIQNGLIICNNDGIPLQIINGRNGLQNNTILSLNTDDFGNLWLGTDNGIDYVEINSNLSIFSYYDGLSAGYAAIFHKGYLYFGTNQGIFYKKWSDFFQYPQKENNFKFIENTRGQVWRLQIFDDKLFCGHHNGTFIIEGGTARKIADIPGCWTFLQLESHPNKIIGGTYTGLILLKKENGKWKFFGKIKAFNETSREMVADKNNSLWISHGYKGVYNISLNNNLDSVVSSNLYNSSNGFKSDYGINVFKLRDEIVFISPNGFFKFDKNKKLFSHYSYFEELFHGKTIKKLCEDQQDDIWYFTEGNSGVMRIQEDGSYLDISLPFRQLVGSFIGGFQFVYTLNERNTFFGTENGFVHYDQLFQKSYDKKFKVFINQAYLSQPDSIICYERRIEDSTVQTILEYDQNNLGFKFSANDFENVEMTKYSTFLKGYDDNWSNWDIRYTKEYTNLKEGDYTFFVKARSTYDVETQASKYSFKIKPPWYKSLKALILFSFIFLMLIFLFFYWVKLRIEKSKMKEKLILERKSKQRENEMKRQTLEAEKEVIRIRNDTLREKMIMKDKELANATMQMIQKNELLFNLKNELKDIVSKSRSENKLGMISPLIKKINKDIESENQWKVFETHFENVHEAFLKRLKNQYTELTPRELKLCAYLRRNISSKEIALLMNISTRGVEISRYRLRKKLNLDRSVNLTDFIISF
ncbi:MAG: hypothetical protein HN704_07835 [Bacteroidetes bacterium]|jgi:ligand-binding sensor domain-containing protein/DNA-binding CsgD family transcriptional regulator|nr:hypothetical protein [Bacteroidota bacterium]MBT6685009.1 hypothetical protein [Bacteroidota bacterium]MBT7143087.1 hypothetical protein [Bacteroidota bacterium]MBT7491500.1 hypothetical protein [Bacteroidota bacterium]